VSLKKQEFDKLDALRNLAGTPYMELLRGHLARISNQLIDVEDVHTILRLQGEARATRRMLDEIAGAEDEANRRLYGTRDKIGLLRSF
jgi:hypothetical protein